MEKNQFLTNRLQACKVPYQGTRKRVLCVCSAGLLRSPTAAYILSTEFDCNTRAAGLDDYALIPVDSVLLIWADEIVCMNASQEDRLVKMCGDMNEYRPIVNLDIPDVFNYRDPTLEQTIKFKYQEFLRSKLGEL